MNRRRIKPFFFAEMKLRYLWSFQLLFLVKCLLLRGVGLLFFLKYIELNLNAYVEFAYDCRKKKDLQ